MTAAVAVRERRLHERRAGQALPLFSMPSAPVSEEIDALLCLIAGDPVHDSDRRVIVAAILAEARARGPRLDPNRLRARLRDEHGRSKVNPRVVGGVMHALARARVLRPDGWVTSTDREGRNAGRPARVWALVGDPR